MTGGDGAIELVEDFIALFLRYAPTSIGELHQRVAVLPVGRKLYLTTVITIFRGIGDEVAHDDDQRIAVGVSTPLDSVTITMVPDNFCLFANYICLMSQFCSPISLMRSSCSSSQ